MPAIRRHDSPVVTRPLTAAVLIQLTPLLSSQNFCVRLLRNLGDSFSFS